MAGVLVNFAHQVVGQQLARLQVVSRGRGDIFELAFREVVLSRQVKPFESNSFFGIVNQQMKRKPHICCSSSSFQHGAHPGLGTEDALVQYPSFVGVLQCFSSLWRQFLIRETLGAGSPLLGFGHFCLLSSWHSVWRGIKSIWNVWNMTIKIAETNLVHQNMGPSFGQSDIIKGWASIISMSESLNLCLFYFSIPILLYLNHQGGNDHNKALLIVIL